MCFLPVKKDWGLKKACYPDEEAREGAPRAALLSHPGRKGSVYPDHKSKQEKRLRTHDQGAFWQPWEQDQD